MESIFLLTFAVCLAVFGEWTRCQTELCLSFCLVSFGIFFINVISKLVCV